MKYFKTIAIALAPILFVIFSISASRWGLFGDWNPESIRTYIEKFGTWAILVYIIILAVNSISVIPPSALVIYSAALLFTPVTGIFAVWTGIVIGSILGFTIARFLAQDFVTRKLQGRADELNEQLKKNGFIIIFMTRLMGIPPAEIVTYGAGLSKISFRDYLLGTMLGALPGAILIVLTGDRLINLNFRDPLAYAFPTFVIVTFLLSILYNKWKRSK